MAIATDSQVVYRVAITRWLQLHFYKKTKVGLDEGIVRTASNRGGIQSSVRDLNCSLKWGNERNPRCLLHVSGETAQLFERKLKRRFKKQDS